MYFLLLEKPNAIVFRDKFLQYYSDVSPWIIKYNRYSSKLIFDSKTYLTSKVYSFFSSQDKLYLILFNISKGAFFPEETEQQQN